jgi:hypothetical protein
VLATLSEDGGEAQLVLINRDRYGRCPAASRSGACSWRATTPRPLLTAGSPDAFNDVDHPASVSPRDVTAHVDEGRTELGPHSLTVVRVALPFPHPAGVVAAASADGAWALSAGVWERRQAG